MKKRLFIIGIVIIAILANITIVQADSTPTVDFKINSSQVKPGNTFTVTISVVCEDGINGIETTYSYDEDKLEFVSGSVSNSNNWSSLSSGNQITVICNSTSKITSADLYVLTFKVKDNAAVGTTAKIITTDILVDSDASTNSESIIKAKTATVTIAGEGGSSDAGTNGDNTGNTGSNTDDSSSNIGNSGSGTTGGSSTGSVSTGTTSQSGTSTSSKNSSTVQEATKKSVSSLPKTGIGIVPTIVIIEIILIVSSYVAYRGYKKYKGIK